MYNSSVDILVGLCIGVQYDKCCPDVYINISSLLESVCGLVDQLVLEYRSGSVSGLMLAFNIRIAFLVGTTVGL